MHLTAAHLYAFVACPHRVWRDAHDDHAERDPVSEFVEMLWEKGTQHERRVIAAHADSLQLTDLSGIPRHLRGVETLLAMRRGDPWIYQGRLEADDLVGEPDLLQCLPDGQYLAVDIKSGMGLEGADEETEGKLKKTYAVQLCLYTDALRRLGFASHFLARVWDSAGDMVDYPLDAARGPRNPQSWWQWYEEVAAEVRGILAGTRRTESALVSACKLCPWYSSCKKQCQGRDDLSLVPELGRSRKEGVIQIALTVGELAQVSVDAELDADGKTGIPGVGEKTLRKLVRRAGILKAGGTKPTILEPFTLPEKPIELYFDIEADPTQDIVYLHGVVERRDGQETFHAFVAREVSAEAEERAWREFWQYIRGLPREEVAVYYYSKYERTQYRRLLQKYPEASSESEVEAFFDPAFAVDLYFDVVLPKTDWPTYNYSVKTLAMLQGFRWRDPNPSGAASIEWFNDFCRTQNPATLQRILDYNEDDCIAMRVVKDCLEQTVSKTARIPTN